MTKKIKKLRKKKKEKRPAGITIKTSHADKSAGVDTSKIKTERDFGLRNKPKINLLKKAWMLFIIASLSVGKYLFILTYYLILSLFYLLKQVFRFFKYFLTFDIRIIKSLFRRGKKPDMSYLRKSAFHPRESASDQRKSGLLTKRLRLVLILILFIGFTSFMVWLFWGLPAPTKLLQSQVPVSTKIYDRTGKIIYEIYADKRSTPVNIDDLPPYVINATISIEDKDFISIMVYRLPVSHALHTTLF